MRTFKIVTVAALLALVVTSCTKDKPGSLRLFAGHFDRQNSKVVVNPANILDAAQWVGGEIVSLNGNPYYIAIDGDHTYLTEDYPSSDYRDPLDDAMKAIYPGGNFGGNVVTVNYSVYSSSTLTIDTLVVDMQQDGTQKMAFPMAASADAGAENLHFDHLCAGFMVTLQKQSGTATVKNLKVIAKGDNASQLGANDVVAQWAVQGPVLPGGQVGQNEDDVDVTYTSEMNFRMRTNGTDGISIGTSGTTFCIPITISNVRRLEFVGYGEGDAVLFSVQKTFTGDDPVTVERNQMYTIPAITIQ